MTWSGGGGGGDELELSPRDWARDECGLQVSIADNLAKPAATIFAPLLASVLPADLHKVSRKLHWPKW